MPMFWEVLYDRAERSLSFAAPGESKDRQYGSPHPLFIKFDFKIMYNFLVISLFVFPPVNVALEM